MSDKKNNPENSLKKLDENDLEAVVGGATSIYNPDGANDIAYTCPKCGFKMKINTRQKWEDGTYKHDWKCPQCHSKNMSIFTYKKNKVFSNLVEGFTYENSEIKNLDL